MTEPGRKEEVQTAPPRARRRRWPLLAAAGVVAATGTLALVALDRPTSEESRLVATEAQGAAPAAPPDPLRAELLRCRTMPPGADDPTCRAAWDESRRQFFGEPSARRSSVAHTVAIPQQANPSDPAVVPAPASANTATPSQER